MKIYRYILATLSVVIAFTSCEKVIDVDLNDSDPKLVVEGQIADNGTGWVALQRSVNFDEDNNFPAVTDAQVTITDSEGNTELLQQALDGLYVTNTVTGVPGRTYTVDITIGDESYTSIATMPAPIEIDTIEFKSGFFPGSKIIDITFQDIPGVDNYYLMLQYRGDGLAGDASYPIGNDQLVDGDEITFNFFWQEEDLQAGDTLTYELYTIDKGVFEYFRTLNQLLGASNSASPANPISNFTNSPLGYFSAHSVRRKYIVLPEF